MGLNSTPQGGGATRTPRLWQPRLFLQLALPLGLLVLWWLALQRQWVRSYQLPAPATVLVTIEEMIQRGELQNHMIATIGRTLASYLIGAFPAVVLGVASGLSPAMRAGVDPTIQGIRAVPSLAWVPLFLLWFGIGEQARLLLIALGAFLPVYLNTIAGVESVDRRLVEVGRAYGLSSRAITFRIVLPGSLPGILTGLRAGLSMAWMFVVAAELIAASNGLGFLLIDGQSTMRPDRVIAAIITFAFLGRASDAGLAAIERYALRWRDTLGTADSNQHKQALSSTLKADRVSVR